METGRKAVLFARCDAVVHISQDFFENFEPLRSLRLVFAQMIFELFGVEFAPQSLFFVLE